MVRWIFRFILLVPIGVLRAQDTLGQVRHLDTLTVTAERRQTPLTATPAVVRVITANQWQSKGAGDLTTLLREIPGLQLDPVVGSGAGISIQGLGSDRVQVLIDGVPVEGRLNNQFDLTRLDPSQFSRIEIVEGPQSTLYGSTALAGVINLISRDPDGDHAVLNTQGGTYGQFDLSGRVSALVGTTGLAFGAGHRHIDIAPGNAIGAPGGADRWDFNASLLRPLGSAVLDVRALYTAELQSYEESFGPGADFGNAARNRQTDVLAALRFGDDATELRVHASVYDHTLDETDRANEITTSDPQAQRLADIELIRRASFVGAEWVLGARGEHEWITSARLTADDEGASTGALYGSADWALSRAFSLSTGARLTAAQRWGTDVAPRIGLVWQGRNGLYAKASVAHGFRAPSFVEQFSNFTNAEALYAVNGNPDLKPETSWNGTAETGIHHRSLALYLRAFDNRLRNFIEADYTGQNGEIAEFTYVNVVKAHTSGAEVGATMTHGIATIEASYAYLDARDETNHQPLLGRAPHTVRAALAIARHGWSATVEGVRASQLPISQDMSTGALIYEGATPRINVRAGVQVSSAWHISAGIDNVNNTIPVNAIAGFGRRWYAGLTWSR